MHLTGVLLYVVVCFSVLAFLFDVTLAQTSIDCSCICPNTTVVLSCRATTENGVIWESPDGLFGKIQFYGGSDIYEGNEKNDSGFNATIVKIEGDFLLTTLEFYSNSSFENQIIQCRDINNNDDSKKCTINYIKSPLAPIDFKNETNRFGIMTLSWKFDDTSIVDHAYLTIQPPPNEDTHVGMTYIIDGRSNFTVTGILANTTYLFSLRVENCGCSNQTSLEVETELYSPATPELCACTTLYNNMDNTTGLNAEVNWQCSQGQAANFYKVKVIGQNNELIHQEYHNTSTANCGMSYVTLPYEGMFIVEVSALNVYGESQPNAKKLYYSSSFLEVKVKDFSEDNMTVICCVKNVNSLSSNASCTVIIKEEKNGTRRFGEESCVIIPINGTLYSNLSYEAYIYDDPDFCYRTYGIFTYNGNINITNITSNSGAEKTLLVALITLTGLLSLFIGLSINGIV